MQRFKQFTESTKIKWKKVPDGYAAGNKKVFKHVSPDGKFEIRLSGMDSMKKNKDGSQKVMPTLFDNTKVGGDIPRHPVTAYRNVDQAKKEAQRWFDTHWNK